MNSILTELLQKEPTHVGEFASAEIDRISEGLFFVASNPAMRKLRSQVELLAQVDVPVFITGESGSGKEITGRLIHKWSARSKGKFATVNCAAVPVEMLESELFGHERGILNGSGRPKAGKLEICQKGTIFLESIADMPLTLQTKLLHALQDKQISRLGNEKTIDIDVRVLASSDANIAQALAEKRLREDLYYRLSAFTVNLPPLRQRNDEIPVLMFCFMRQLAEQYGLPQREFPQTVLAACQRYSWPGNLRELENFVKRYLVMGDEDLALGELTREPMNGACITCASDAVLARSGVETSHDETPSLKSVVESVKEEAERNAIAAALDQTRWNRKAAARLLKVSYRTLLYKIEQYRMSPPAQLSSLAPETSWKGNGHF